MSDFTQIYTCRKCGELLDIPTKYLICVQFTPSKFSYCSHFVDDPIHSNCVIMSVGSNSHLKMVQISKTSQMTDKKPSDFLYTWILGESRAK